MFQRLHAPGLIAVVLLTVSPAAAQTRPPVEVRPGQPIVMPPRDPVPPRQVATRSVVRGRVVDGVRGTPIARARVRLMGANPANRSETRTNADGAFTFSGVAAGNFTLMVDKASYVNGTYPTNRRTLRSAMQSGMIVDGQTLEVTVPMFHGGAITGRVVDSYGDPIDNAEVRLFSVPRGGQPQMMNQSSTNDIGEFRVGRLNQGRYLLSVSPRIMQFDDGFLPAPQQLQVYPQPLPTYYPNGASLEQAQPITVNRGETISGIEIILGEGIPSIITGTVVGPDGPVTNMNGGISARPVTKQNMPRVPNMGGGGLRPDGTFRLQLAPGEYVIEAQMSPRQTPGQPYQPGNEQFGSVQLAVPGNSVESVTIMIGRGATASGRVLFEGTTPIPPPPPEPVRVPLFSDGPACRGGMATVSTDWTFKVDGLSGTCSPPPSVTFGRWMIKSVSYRGENLLERGMTFDPGQQYGNVQIVMTDKRTQLEFRVSGDDGQLTREYAALIYPTDKAKWTQSMRPPVRTFVPRPPPTGSGRGTMTMTGSLNANTTVAPDGTMRDTYLGLAPGDYFVIALDDIAVEDMTDVAVLERLARYAARVTVADEAVVDVPLRRVTYSDVIR
jgi:Carboxypeptidase regulatory-like domain